MERRTEKYRTMQHCTHGTWLEIVLRNSRRKSRAPAHTQRAVISLTLPLLLLTICSYSAFEQQAVFFVFRCTNLTFLSLRAAPHLLNNSVVQRTLGTRYKTFRVANIGLSTEVFPIERRGEVLVDKYCNLNISTEL